MAAKRTWHNTAKRYDTCANRFLRLPQKAGRKNPPEAAMAAKRTWHNTAKRYDTCAHNQANTQKETKYYVSN